MPPLTFDSKIYIITTWTTPSILNSLLKFPDGTDTRWGLLRWDEAAEGDNFVTVDILKDSDNTVLVSWLRHMNQGVDLSEFPAIGLTEDIKVRFNLHTLDKSPIIRNIRVHPLMRLM